MCIRDSKLAALVIGNPMDTATELGPLSSEEAAVNIADQVKSGEYESEEIRMELQIQANNISQMIKNLDDLVRMVAEERGEEIPKEFREFLLGK